MTAIATLAEASQADGGVKVRLAGTLTNIEHRVSKQNRAWATATLSDGTGALELLIYPDVLASCLGPLRDAVKVSVFAHVETCNDGTVRLTADLVLSDEWVR